MVLYRKYRPKTFKEVIGQKNIVQILENEVKSGKIAHAYLFTGPRGLGKTTLSRIMAKTLNCQNRKENESEPCNKCDYCQAINQGRFMDLIELDAASQTGVDNVRENIIKYSRIPPTQGKYKVFVIDECHMHKLPETIVSRCQRFDFNKVNLEEIVERMEKIVKAEKIKVSKKILETIALRSEGCVRDAESLLSQILSLNGKEITEQEASLVIPPTQTDSIIKFAEFLLKNEQGKAIKMINELLEQGINLEQFVSDLIEFLRKILLLKAGAVSDNTYWQVSKDTQKRMQVLSDKLELKRLISIIEEFIKTKVQFNYTDIPQLPVEIAILKICE